LAEKAESPPTLSVVVVVHNMRREAPRTLFSLSADYQRYIKAEDYEVIVIDNGSDPPFDPKELDALRGNFRLIRIDPASPSPAQAINRGLTEARGDVIGVMIDGARLVTPGLLHFARHGACLYDRAAVATLGWYLGYDLQTRSIEGGYDQSREDALLDSIDWPRDGYRLFEIATMDESSIDGWFQPISESNALFMRRESWEALDGVDERFDAPGGGLLNLDTFRRALELPASELIVLPGEATFHQSHGGVSTNAPPEQQDDNWTQWAGQYARVRGHPYQVPQTHVPTYIGKIPQSALARMAWSAINPSPRNSQPPLGADFDKERWSRLPLERPNDATIAALVDLTRTEFRNGRFSAAGAVARLTCTRFPDELEPQRLLTLVAPWLSAQGAPLSQNAACYVALGQARRLLGEGEQAAANFREALTFQPDCAEAHLGLAALRMPGEDYRVCLGQLYDWLAPETVIEIGVYEGSSLALLRPPTLAIGIDPSPTITCPLQTETYVFAGTSDEFFAQGHHQRLLGSRPLSVAFIDGLHLYEQALKDFVNLEACCGPHSVILFHDTVPLDEPTQRRARQTQFHSGDVWRAILCLKHYRSDLDIFTIATPPTGLTVVTRLNPASRVLVQNYDEAVARFIDVPFAEIEDELDDMLNIVPNAWTEIRSRIMKSTPQAARQRS
jgi:hypothetical protein